MHQLKISFIAILVTAGIAWALPAFAEIPTMTVSEISPGMKGVGRTVIQGTQIEEFNVEVIDVFKDMGYDGGPLIFIRISGDVVNRSGGIAGGYSGSPVFIDGRLIGAISWGPYFTEGDLCGVTPIDNMLRAFTYERTMGGRIASEPMKLENRVEFAGRTFDSVLLASMNDDPAELERLWGENTLVMTQARTPLIVSGLNGAAFEKLEEFASERLQYMDIIRGPGGGSSTGVPILLGPTVLEPGASIGVQLASGDLDLTAVGTLTWISDDGRFLALGHPFMNDGPTNLPFVTTKIIYTIPSISRSYKLGEPIDMVGTVTQDRNTMVAGYLRQPPEMVDFRLEIIDRDINRTRRYNYSVINKEDWLPILGWIMPMEGISYAVDRMGKGTCKVSFTIRGEGLAEPIVRENLIYAGFDIGYEALNEFMEALYIPTAMNPFREVKLTSVDISIEVTSERRTLDIIRARFNNAPNMGPGAIGYSGPGNSGTNEYEELENIDLIEEQMLFDDYEGSEMEDVPFEEEMAAYIEGLMVDAYDMGMTVTKLVGYYPGDTVEILVTLRPWRDKTVEKIIKIKIPDDFPTGQTTIDILGGTSSSYALFGMMNGGTFTDSGVYLPPEDLETVIENFMKRDVNNSVITRLNWIATGNEDPYFYLQDDMEITEPVTASLVLDDVVYGWFSLPIEILSMEAESLSDVEEQIIPGSEYDQYVEPVQKPDSAPGRNPYRN